MEKIYIRFGEGSRWSIDPAALRVIMRSVVGKISSIAVATAFVLGSAASWADTVIINNHSFEDDVHADGVFTDGLVSSWILDQNEGVIGTWNPVHAQTGCCFPDPFINDIPDGLQVAYSKGGELLQQTGATITEGHRYTLKVGVGGRCNLGGIPYAVLLVGDAQVGATTGTQISLLGGWVEETVTYEPLVGDPNLGQPLTVVLESQGGPQLNWDNVRLDDSIIVMNVDIDIKPGSDSNSINLCSNGAVPLAIFGSAEFDVYNVNTESLRFSDASVKVVGKKDPNTLCSYEDVNGDAFVDVICHFVTMDIAALDGESTMVAVNGELLDGTPIEGMDSVNIVKNGGYCDEIGSSDSDSDDSGSRGSDSDSD